MPLSCRVVGLWQSQQLEGQRLHLLVPIASLTLAHALQVLVDHDVLGAAYIGCRHAER